MVVDHGVSAAAGEEPPATSFYDHGAFSDLCKGPHVASTADLGPFRLLADPRLPQVTAADYAEQFRAATAVRDSINAVTAALEMARAVREQAVRAVEQAGRINRAI